jgi:hypothetical protein
MVALPVLVSGLEAEMIRLGYKDSTMVWYQGAWRRLQRYFAARGVEEFFLDVAMEWVDGTRTPASSTGSPTSDPSRNYAQCSPAARASTSHAERHCA